MKREKRNLVITAFCVAAASIGTWLSLRKKNKAKNDSRVQNFVQKNAEGNQIPTVNVKDSSEEIIEKSVTQPEGKEETHKVTSPFLEEAIKLAIESKLEVDPEFFYHPTVNDVYSSLHPIIRIVPGFRFDGDLGKTVPAKRLDIIFPIPQALFMEGLDMGLYYNCTGKKELQGKTKLDRKVFHHAFGANKRAGSDKDERVGYIPKVLHNCLPCYPRKDVEVKREIYFNVSYLVWDPRSHKFVRRHKLYNGAKCERVKEVLNNKNEVERDKAVCKLLTEIYETYSLSTTVEEIPTDIIDPKFLERSDSHIADDQTEIEDVIYAHRVSFFLSDDEEYPLGITPYGLAKILSYMSNKLDISEYFKDTDDKRYKYAKPWMIEEWPWRRGELNVLSLVDPDDEEFKLKSIPIIPRDQDRCVEDEVNKTLLPPEE